MRTFKETVGEQPRRTFSLHYDGVGVSFYIRRSTGLGWMEISPFLVFLFGVDAGLTRLNVQILCNKIIDDDTVCTVLRIHHNPSQLTSLS